MNIPENLKLGYIVITLYEDLKKDVSELEKIIGELDDTTKKVMFSLLLSNIKALLEAVEEFDKKGEIY